MKSRPQPPAHTRSSSATNPSASADAEPGSHVAVTHSDDDDDNIDDPREPDPDRYLADLVERELGPHDDEPGTPLIDADDIARAISACGNDAETSSLENDRRRALLKRWHDDPDSLFRQSLIADDAMVARLRDLAQQSPNCAAAIRIVIRAAVLSAATSRPMRVPPLLLVGPPGCGKSRVAAAIAAAIGTGILEVQGPVIADSGALCGRNVAWRGAGPGRIASHLLATTMAETVVLIDEAEKLNRLPGETHPLNKLLILLEPTTARHFSDDYLDVPMRADGIFWVFTANVRISRIVGSNFTPWWAAISRDHGQCET